VRHRIQSYNASKGVRRNLEFIFQCIFQESRLYRDAKKQPKDLKPLLSRSSNDVIDLRTRMFEVHQRQREMLAAGKMTNATQ
jgi:hypothetical protein